MGPLVWGPREEHGAPLPALLMPRLPCPGPLCPYLAEEGQP